MSDRIPTLADVCCAIAEGHVPAAVDGNMYQVNAFVLRRHFTRPRPLPSVSQSSSSLSSSKQWPSSSRTSVA